MGIESLRVLSGGVVMSEAVDGALAVRKVEGVSFGVAKLGVL